MGIALINCLLFDLGSVSSHKPQMKQKALHLGYVYFSDMSNTNFLFSLYNYIATIGDINEMINPIIVNSMAPPRYMEINL